MSDTFAFLTALSNAVAEKSSEKAQAQPQAQAQTKQAKLILLTMVKNESRIIQRLMNSVKGKCDAIVVLDTGSTDNTVELAKQYLKENGIPGDVYESPFVNFGKTRTKSFTCCQDWVASQVGWDASNCWALLLDGDMMLGPEQAIDREKIASLPETVAGISLKQANGSLVYGNVRLIRVSEPWICKGATHEAWTCPPGKQVANVDSPVLIDHNDGGCKADKYPRDVRLLLEDLAEMPNDARTHFYLGQTYLCMGAHDKAIPVLKRRIEIGGWDEEVYIAYMYLGECEWAVGRKADAMKTWLDGWQFRQHRTEIPMKLISEMRKEPKSQFLGMMFFEKLFAVQKGEDFRTGARLTAGPVVNNDTLFVNKRNTDYHMWEEMGILAYYTGAGRACWLRLDELDMTCNLHWHDFNGLFGQMHWYDWTLKPKSNTRLKLPLKKLPWIDEDDAHVWQPFNPSVRQKADGSGYELNIRYANYYTNEAKHYHYRGFEGKVLTRNLFTTFSKEPSWNDPDTLTEIKIDEKHTQHKDDHIQGMEDCRLIQGSSELEFLGTSKSYADNGINKIFHVVASSAGDATKPWQIQQLPLPPCSHPGECQKNWMGFVSGGQKLYVYSFTPLRVCDMTGKIVSYYDTFKAANGKFNIKEYRGSAGPVAWSSAAFPDERWLCVMHKVYIGGDGRRYYHRFMTLDKDLKPSRVSCFVRMTKERVEYWSGMCPSLDGNSYWITYGLKDSEGYIAELESKEIEELLFYILKMDGTMTPTQKRFEVLAKY